MSQKTVLPSTSINTKSAGQAKVFGSEKCWNDLTIKDKDESIDCSQYRKTKKKNSQGLGQELNLFRPGTAVEE